MKPWSMFIASIATSVDFTKKTLPFWSWNLRMQYYTYCHAPIPTESLLPSDWKHCAIAQEPQPHFSRLLRHAWGYGGRILHPRRPHGGRRWCSHLQFLKMFYHLNEVWFCQIRGLYEVHLRCPPGWLILFCVPRFSGVGFTLQSFRNNLSQLSDFQSIYGSFLLRRSWVILA